MTAKPDDVELPAITAFVLAQSQDAFCDKMKQLAALQNCLSTFDEYGFFERQAPYYEFIQKLVLLSIPPIILYFTHHSTLGGQSRKR